MSIGGAHSVALDTANGGNVWTWGLNSAGQLGDGTLVLKTSPVQVLTSVGGPALTGITAIAAGGKHTLALAADGTVWAWGYNATGQLGDGTVTNSTTPKQVPSLTGVTAIAAGGDFSLALKSDGTVLAWGNNGKGQLGNNTFGASRVPVQVLMHATGTPPTLTGIIAIAAGGSHALALKDDGTVYAWGYNEFGQLGDGTIISSSTAVAVDGTGPADTDNKVVTAISAGLDHSVAIVDGNVYTWGYNYYGQLGDGAELASYLPVKELQQVVTDQVERGREATLAHDVVEIVATGHYCIARDSAGKIWTWGRNTHGELGDGTTVSRSKAKIILPAS